MKRALMMFILLFALATPALATGMSYAQVRGQYGTLMVTLADELAKGGADYYAVNCGGPEVSPSSARLSELSGLDPSNIVCVLTARDGSGQNADHYRAIIFSQDPGDTGGTEAAIAHLANYRSGSDNDDTIYIDGLNTDACIDSLSDTEDTEGGSDWVDNLWHECEDVVEGLPDGVEDRNKYHLYFRGGTPNAYLVTWNFEPEFSQNGWQTFWGGVADFFRGVFGISGSGGSLTDTELEAFSSGYFAWADGAHPTEVRAIYHENGGKAYLMLKNFAESFESIAPRDGYFLGSDNTQILQFEGLTKQQWTRLTSQLRIEGNDGAAFPGDVCGQELPTDPLYLGFNEDCEIDPNEPRGFRYWPNQGSCEDLGYSFGTLACNPRGTVDDEGTDIGCSFDTSACVQCADADSDGYPVANDVPGGLRTVSGAVRYGGATLDTSYSSDIAYEASNDFRIAFGMTADGLGLGAQALPAPLEHFVQTTPLSIQDTISTATVSLSSAYNICDPDTHGVYYCLGQVLDSPQGDQAMKAAGFGGFVASRLKYAADITDTTQPCTYSSADGWTCSAVHPHMLGDFGPLYGEDAVGGSEGPIVGMAKEGVKPIVFIEPGQYAHENMDVAHNMVRLAIYCGGLAYGMNQEFDDDTEEDMALDTFVYMLEPHNDPDMTVNEYWDTYRICRVGIKAALSPSASLYYNLGTDDLEDNPYKDNLLLQLSQRYDSRHSLVDGIVTDNPQRFVNGEKLFSLTYTGDDEETEYAGDELLRELGTGIIATPIVNGAEYFHTIDMLFAALGVNARALLFYKILDDDTDTNFGSDDGLSRMGTLLTTIMTSVKDSTETYVQKKKTATGAKALVLRAAGITTDIYLYGDGVGHSPLPEGLEFSECAESTIEVPDADGAFEVPDPALAPADFADGIPEGANGLSHWLLGQSETWECFLGETSLAGACAAWLDQNGGNGMNVEDCNDDPMSEPVSGTEINPGKPEVCGNGVDDDCDGFIDDQDTFCEPGYPPSDECDFDERCEEEIGETPFTCSDCNHLLYCPKAAIPILTFNGFSVDVGFDDMGTAEISVTPTCEPVHGSDTSRWAEHENFVDPPEGCRTKSYLWTGSRRVISDDFYFKGDDHWLRAEIEDTPTGWSIQVKMDDDDPNPTAKASWSGCALEDAAVNSECIRQEPQSSSGSGTYYEMARIDFWDAEPCGMCPTRENVQWEFIQQAGAYTIERGVMRPGEALLKVTTDCTSTAGGDGYGASRFCELKELKNCATDDREPYSIIYTAGTGAADLYQEWDTSKCVARDVNGDLIGSDGHVGFCAEVKKQADRWIIQFHDDGQNYQQGSYSNNIADARSCWGYDAAPNPLTIEVPYPDVDCTQGCARPCQIEEDCSEGYSCTLGCCQRDSTGGGGGGGCFTPDTLVKTPEGYTPIGELHAGDEVVSYDLDRDVDVVSRIAWVKALAIDETLVINGDLKTTDVHPFYTTRGWIKGGDLILGDEIQNEAGGWIDVASLTHEPYEGLVYDLHVENEPHNYYAGGYLAHNKMNPFENME